MEKEGFIRDMNDLNSRNISIKTLVTDRHPQIQKYTRENMENTNHEFDAWHIVKGKDRLIFGGVSSWVSIFHGHREKSTYNPSAVESNWVSCQPNPNLNPALTFNPNLISYPNT